MIYTNKKCDDVLNNISTYNRNKENKYYKNIIDCRKFEYYRNVNNLDDSIVQHLLTLTNEYQEQQDIQTMCLTNSFLFKEILDELGYQDFDIKCGMWVMKLDCHEFLVAHVVLYSKLRNKIIDPSWWASRNMGDWGGYFTFDTTRVIDQAYDKKKIKDKRSQYRTFVGLDECTQINVHELDESNSQYYTDVLNYLREKSGYKFLDEINYFDE